MIVKVTKHGHSFKGAAAYYLHDKPEENAFNRASQVKLSTQERVEWTETKNLCTDNPETAWKIMAATAMDSERMKAEHREANGQRAQASGDTNPKSVYAFSVAWHPDEAGQISREEMTAAANDILERLGFEDHQTMFVAHNDTDHPHLHVIVNKVHPETGKVHNPRNDWNTTDRYAYEYRRDRDQEHYCSERALKWRNHDEGRSNKHREKQTASKLEAGESELMNSNDPEARQVRRDQARFGKRLSDIGERMNTRHETERKTLKDDLKRERIHIYAQFKPQLDPAKDRAKQAHADKQATYKETEPKLSAARDRLAQAKFKRDAIYDKFKAIHAREYETTAAKFKEVRKGAARKFGKAKRQWQKNETTIDGRLVNAIHGARAIRGTAQSKGFIRDVVSMSQSKHKRAAAFVDLEQRTFDQIGKQQQAENKANRQKVNQVRKSELAPSQAEYKAARAEISNLFEQRKAAREDYKEARAELDEIFSAREPLLAAQKLNAEQRTGELGATQKRDTQRLQAAWAHLKNRRTAALRRVKHRLQERQQQRTANQQAFKDANRDEAIKETKKRTRNRSKERKPRNRGQRHKYGYRYE